MFCVKCCKCGGIELEVPFDSVEEACAHALKLRHLYGVVEIVDAETCDPVEF